MELVDFLCARLDDDEAAAKAATAGPWRVDSESYAEAVYGADGTEVVAGGRWGGEASVFESTEDAIHIARHDPARVLAEVEAKRRIVDLTAGMLEAAKGDSEVDHYGGLSVAEDTLLLLARPFRDHLDFDPSWLQG